MLIRFGVSNFRSIADPVELSMVAIDRDRDSVRDVPNIGEGLLTRAAIYGPNASGKSNVLLALNWLREGVRDSLRFWEDEVPVEPFAFDAWPLVATEFSLDVAVDGIRHEYELEVTKDGVAHEALFEYPERRRRRVFERSEHGITFARGLGAIAGSRELMTPRTLALSTIRRFEDPKVGRFIKEILSWQVLDAGFRRVLPGRVGMRSYDSTARMLLEAISDQPNLFEREGEETVGGRERGLILGLLRMADLGVEDVQVVEELQVTLSGKERVERRLQLIHRGGDARLPFEMDVESHGTQTWFTMIGPAMRALQTGSLLIVDELDASLHPALSVQLLRLFGDKLTNPRGAQLIFTAHDTNLLDELNRDEVWLTEKLPRGSTRLGALSDFAGERVRQSQNLANAYLHGKFGAIPDIDRTDFLRALGLIG